MKLIWNSIKNKIFKQENSQDDKEYLVKLVENLERYKIKNKNISFVITGIKEKGFIVKVGGLFAYISFQYMPWKYSTIEFWKVISKYLIGKKFYCNIHRIDKEPLSILINAENHKFRSVELSENSKYSGIVINKAKYGLFVDIGYHFDWEYGSLVGLIHKSNISETEYEQTKVGDELKTVFQGYTEDRKLILGNKSCQKEWLTGELDNLIGTIQQAVVKITEDGKKEFYIKGKYKTAIPLNKINYPECRTRAKHLIRNLENNDIIQCEIMKINKKKRMFVSKLLLNKTDDFND